MAWPYFDSFEHICKSGIKWHQDERKYQFVCTHTKVKCQFFHTEDIGNTFI